jgi:hypothetical protein
MQLALGLTGYSLSNKNGLHEANRTGHKSGEFYRTPKTGLSKLISLPQILSATKTRQ